MSELSLASDFEAATREQWLALVGKALKGGDFEKKLVGRTYDGIRIEPLYTRAHAVEAPAPAIARPDDRWEIRQRHALADAKAANAAIVEDLDGGVAGITLQLAAPGQTGLPATLEAMRAALDGVRLDWVSLAVEAGAGFEEALAPLVALARSCPDPAKARLVWNADPLGALARTGAAARDWDGQIGVIARAINGDFATFPNSTAILVDGRPYHEAGASEAQELAAFTASLVAYLRALETKGVAPATALARAAFAVSADAQIFAAIAKLRAARRLVARVAEACGVAATPIHITAETSARMLAKRDAYTNMLRTTVATAAAAMGGADAITVLPFTWPLGQPDAFARRMARNTQIVLMEESSLGRVADPAKGSWYVEKLTDELAAKSWSLFQDIEGKGGMLASLQSGHVQALVAQTAAERARNLATGREELIGVANFPTLAETRFEVTPHPVHEEMECPALTVEPLAPRRAAEPFERLRDIADVHASRTGKRATVFLANLGTIPEFNARATFAQNFLAAGGIEVSSNEGFKTSAEAAKAFAESGAEAACICSTDKSYALLAEATAQALTHAGAKHVLLAGRPGDKLEAYRAAGIGTCIYMGCDAIATLAGIQDALGVRA
jgi:methylmalonyl-CoA mutase